MRQDPSGWSVRLDEDIASSYVRSGQWHNRTLAHDFARLVADDPDWPAIVQADIVVTRRELLTQAQALAGSLLRLGLGTGTVLSVMLPNWPEAAIVDLAAAITGMVLNPIVPIYRAAETKFILNDCRSRVLFIPQQFRGFDYVRMMREIRNDLPHLRHIIVVRSTETATEMLDWRESVTGCDVDFRNPQAPEPNAIKLVLYTSGTTGAAKGVLHSHNTIGAEIHNVARHWALSSSDTVFMPSPLTHITGYLYGIQMPLTIGMTAVYLDQWNPRAAFALLDRHRCTWTVAATPFLRELIDIADASKRALPHLRYFACGGAPVPPELVYEARRAFSSCITCRIYGSTEAPTVTLGPTTTENERAATTDGVVVGHQIKLVNSEGRKVEEKQEGEVLTRGAELFLGYTNTATNIEAFDADGYFRTGDLACEVEPGWLKITGRVKDLIIRGGENISAKEVEDVLHQHPSVHEAAVVAMPHPRLGETCCAFIIPKKGHTITLAEVAELIATSGLAKQKTPERIEFVQEFPRTASGKIRKVDLRNMIAERLATGPRVT
jgi:acyl-CoA synthetase (AMP-forming)/AMP-acid ligase II